MKPPDITRHKKTDPRLKWKKRPEPRVRMNPWRAARPDDSVTPGLNVETDEYLRLGAIRAQPNRIPPHTVKPAHRLAATLANEDASRRTVHLLPLQATIRHLAVELPQKRPWPITQVVCRMLVERIHTPHPVRRGGDTLIA